MNLKDNVKIQSVDNLVVGNLALGLSDAICGAGEGLGGDQNYLEGGGGKPPAGNGSGKQDDSGNKKDRPPRNGCCCCCGSGSGFLIEESEIIL